MRCYCPLLNTFVIRMNHLEPFSFDKSSAYRTLVALAENTVEQQCKLKWQQLENKVKYDECLRELSYYFCVRNTSPTVFLGSRYFLSGNRIEAMPSFLSS